MARTLTNAISPHSGDAGAGTPERIATDAGTEPVNDAATKTAKPAEPKHRHRKLVWALVVLASIVLVVSMIANWVQTQVLNSGEFSNSTEKILQNKDVQQQLSIFAVDQLYANVDVQAQIEQRLPPPAAPLAAPVTAATRQLATNVAETALASPQVQQSRRHRDRWGAAAVRQPDREQGPVRLDAGRRRHPRIRELRRRPCHSPGRRPLDDLPDPGLHPAVLDGAQAAPDDDPEQDRVHAINALPGAGGHAHPGGATEPHDSRNGCRPAPHDRREPPAEDRGHPAEGSRPAPGPVVRPPGSPGQARQTARPTVQAQAAAVLKDPSQANILKLDPTLASLQTRVTDLLNRQAIQHPGELVDDEVQRAERSPGPRQGAAQPRLRAAGAGAPAVPGAPSTWRRAGAARH